MITTSPGTTGAAAVAAPGEGADAPARPTPTRGSWLGRALKYASTAASLVAILVGVWIRLEQGHIEERQKEREKRITAEHMTVEFTDKIFGHLGDLAIVDRKQRESVVIDLLGMVTEARTSQSGEGGDAEHLRTLPLRLALVAGNDESLAELGGVPDLYRAWMDYAKLSGNESIRVTALRALNHICLASSSTSAAGPQLAGGERGEPLLGYVGDVLALSDDLRTDVSEVREASVTVLQTILRVMARDPLRYRNTPALDGLRSALANLVGAASSAGGATSEGTVVTRAAGALQAMTDSGLVREPAAVVKAAPPPALPGPPAPSALDSLVDTLASAKGDDRAAAAMALYAFKRRAPLDGLERARQLVEALGDPDPAVRKYVAEFLMRNADRNIVDAVWSAMKPVLQTPVPGNRLYNCAVVCTTWTRVLPGDLDDLRERMREWLKRLRETIGDKNEYRRTAALLEEADIHRGATHARP